MKKTLILSEETLKGNSLIGPNVESSTIIDTVYMVQELDLKSILGSRLYKFILNLIENETIGNAEFSDYKLLSEDYITNYLILKTLGEIQLKLSYKFKNAGIVTTNDDNINNAQMGEIFRLMSYYNNKAEKLANQMIEFIKCNTDRYPQYCTNTNPDVQPDKSGFRSHIYFY